MHIYAYIYIYTNIHNNNHHHHHHHDPKFAICSYLSNITILTSSGASAFTIYQDRGGTSTELVHPSTDSWGFQHCGVTMGDVMIVMECVQDCWGEIFLILSIIMGTEYDVMGGFMGVIRYIMGYCKDYWGSSLWSSNLARWKIIHKK